MKKVFLIVVSAIGMMAPTFAQNTVQLQPQSTGQSFPTQLPYYAPVPQPQVIVRNYPPAPVVKVTNPEVTVPVTIQPYPMLNQVPIPNDDFTGHEILFMILIAFVAGIIGFIFGIFTRRGNGPERMIVHNHGGSGGRSISESRSSTTITSK